MMALVGELIDHPRQPLHPRRQLCVVETPGRHRATVRRCHCCGLCRRGSASSRGP